MQRLFLLPIASPAFFCYAFSMDLEDKKTTFKLLSIPLFLLGIYLFLALIWKIFHLPTDQALYEILKGYFGAYGLWLVFFGAIIEGFLLLGQYFPGGLIIFLGVITAGNDLKRVVFVVSIVCFSFLIAYSLNYLVGKYGWYKLLVKFGLKDSLEEAKRKLIKHEFNAIFLSYWEPNLASITATAAGILFIPFKRFFFFSVISVIFWNTFWGTLVHSLGQDAIKIMGIKYVLVIFSFWILILLLKKKFSKKPV